MISGRPVGKPGTVAWVTNSGELATAKRYLAKRTEERFRSAATEHGNDLIRACIALSQGNLTESDLRHLGNPYAKRLLANSLGPGRPDSLINIGRGNFIQHWHWHLYKATSAWIILVWNDSDEARYMAGTEKMRERPILKQARKLTDKRRKAAFQKAVDEAIVENNVQMAPLPSFGVEINSIRRIEGSAVEQALGFGSGGGTAGAGSGGIGGLLSAGGSGLESNPINPLLVAIISGSSDAILALVKGLS